jgi:hypothetical protein
MSKPREPFEPEVVKVDGPGVRLWFGPDDNDHDPIVEVDVVKNADRRTLFLDAQERRISERVRRTPSK